MVKSELTYQQKYYQDNKERLKEYQREYWKTHTKKKSTLTQKEYYLKNIDKIKAYTTKNRAKLNEYARQYRQRN